ncbi:MAG: hypothetical protein FWG42_09380 [Clostridiales bacterium]|nr:hypothetical protein [Clostridiales bacterium]
MKTCRILAILLAVCLLFTLAACGSSSALSGKYVIVNITDDPDGVTFADLDAMYKEAGENLEDYMYVEFLENSRFALVMFGEVEATGTYARKGKTLTLTEGRETTTAEISGKKVTWTYENSTKLVFKKK